MSTMRNTFINFHPVFCGVAVNKFSSTTILFHEYTFVLLLNSCSLLMITNVSELIPLMAYRLIYGLIAVLKLYIWLLKIVFINLLFYYFIITLLFY